MGVADGYSWSSTGDIAQVHTRRHARFFIFMDCLFELLQDALEVRHAAALSGFYRINTRCFRV